MSKESSAVNPYNGMFGQQGWVCPKCGRVFSPYTQMCIYCRPDNSPLTTNLSSATLKNVTKGKDEIK